MRSLAARALPGSARDRIFPTRPEVFCFGPPEATDASARERCPCGWTLAEEIYGIPDFKGCGFRAHRGRGVCQCENTSNGDFLIDRHPERDTNLFLARLVD